MIETELTEEEFETLIDIVRAYVDVSDNKVAREVLEKLEREE